MQVEVPPEIDAPVSVQRLPRQSLARALIATKGPSKFGALLQAYRKRANLTQTELADFSTVSVRAIRDLELSRAQRPRRGTVRLLADGLRLTGEQRTILEVAAGHDAVSAALHASYGARPFLPSAPHGPLLGRDCEERRLYDSLASGPDRLVTVAGMAGVGKTRLLLAVAQKLYQQTLTPVLWVPAGTGPAHLAEYGNAEAEHVLVPWLRDLFARQGKGVDDLASFIAERRFLLVLDGQDMNQVTADLLDRLLSHCPRLRIASTTRTPAPHPAQRLFSLRPLAVTPLPSPAEGGTLKPDPAAGIVHWHICHLQPERQFTANESAAIRRLCWWLDGIPLALESAATWLQIASPTRLVETAKRDPFSIAAPPSDRDSAGWLRSALSYAVSALPHRQRRLLTALSEWECPWSLDDVTSRTGEPLGDVAYAVHGLLFHNLIRPVEAEGDSPGTFTVLNTVRHLVLARATLAAKLRPATNGSSVGYLSAARSPSARNSDKNSRLAFLWCRPAEPGSAQAAYLPPAPGLALAWLAFTAAAAGASVDG